MFWWTWLVYPIPHAKYSRTLISQYYRWFQLLCITHILVFKLTTVVVTVSQYPPYVRRFIKSVYDRTFSNSTHNIIWKTKKIIVRFHHEAILTYSSHPTISLFNHIIMPPFVRRICFSHHLYTKLHKHIPIILTYHYFTISPFGKLFSSFPH